MIKSNVKANTEIEMREIETKLKQTGYMKISDCMWAKIYEKNNNMIIVEREF